MTHNTVADGGTGASNSHLHTLTPTQAFKTLSFPLVLKAGQMNGWTVRLTDGETGGRRDKASYRIVCSQLRIFFFNLNSSVNFGRVLLRNEFNCDKLDWSHSEDLS